MSRIALRGGLVVDGRPPYRADVLIEQDRIVAVGDLDPHPAADVLDCSGRLVVPGLVDAHAHIDGAVFRPDVQLALLRQGITAVVVGQDGVSFAPGNGEFAGRYFAAVNGPHPNYRGGGVEALLAGYDGAIPLGVAYLVPAGTVRHEVMRALTRRANPAEVIQMTALVADGIAQGAVGLSSGLDYVPGLYADATELAALCAPVAAAGLPYVTHMRGGYEDNARAGIEEVARIAKLAGVRVHVSHFHTSAEQVWRLMGELADQGVDASFDSYPYTRGCTLLSLAMLPPELAMLGAGAAVDVLRSPDERDRLRRDWFPRVASYPSLGRRWPEMITVGHTPAAEFSWAHGKTIADIGRLRGTDPVDTVLDLLAASRLEVNVIMAVPNQRPIAELGRVIAHPRHVGGSDGIYVGAHPHPRGWGAFASYLGTYTRDHGFFDWAEAVRHLATAPAERFGLGRRGHIRPGFVADIAVIDPSTVGDTASYAEPTRLANGIDDVLVGGRPVLAQGRLTGALPGGGIRGPATAKAV